MSNSAKQAKGKKSAKSKRVQRELRQLQVEQAKLEKRLAKNQRRQQALAGPSLPAAITEPVKAVAEKVAEHKGPVLAAATAAASTVAAAAINVAASRVVDRLGAAVKESPLLSPAEIQAVNPQAPEGASSHNVVDLAKREPQTSQPSSMTDS